tara:strand:+ start:709 stop:1317 length:609 start_codon:yes stop_codon:yes gene_type:complete
MRRKNKRRFDPRYFMDEKTDKKVIKVDEKTDKKVLKEVMPRLTQLPDEPDLLQYGDEQRMDQISKELEKQFADHTIVTVQVPDFDGSMVNLDTFLAKMGNYVVTGDVSMEQAKAYIDQIVDNLTVDRDVLNYWEKSDPYDDPDYALSEMKPGAASGGISDRRYQTSRADSSLNEKFDTVVDALGQIGKIAHGAVSAVQTEND